jgi:hypothetical protein
VQEPRRELEVVGFAPCLVRYELLHFLFQFQ